ncbi:MAG: ribonuclease D [Acidimicrobiales bacterium]
MSLPLAPGAEVPRLITDTAELDALAGRLLEADRYALDTEFHRERTYWPRVALVQIAWPGGPLGPAGVALVDPLAVDLTALAVVLAGPGVMVAHAAEQDLEVLERACGRGPTRLFDTQVAAGFAGHGFASLSALSGRYLAVDVAKGDRLTDWNRRPLSASQLAYAASDVEHLLELATAVGVSLDRSGRRSWAEEECAALLDRSHATSDLERAWWKLRDARQLRGPSRGVAQEVAAWREHRAQELDQPVRSVLPDLALQSIAHHPPHGSAELAAVRGLEGRQVRGAIAAGLLDAIARGRKLPAERLQLPPADEVARELRPAIALAMAWVAQVARDQEVDAALLATRADLVAYLRDEPDARLARGWRAGMVGRPLRRLLDGQLALAFDGSGGLILEERSHRGLAE